ncbi:MAG: NAD+ synthase [Euryarchaeota archaeon]|nr:NAD+ synthase [Euryarchaeota archaeon]
MLDLSDSQLELAREIIENSIRSRIRKAGAEGGVVAMSGGLDSSLVAKLASEALGKRLLALLMPEDGVTRPEDTVHARAWAEELGIEYRLVEIGEALRPLEAAFKGMKKGDKGRRLVAWGNVKPKVRMVLNYMVANLESRIVIGTSNKTEMLLGYTTKYGDGGVDIQPIGDLYKTQVRQLARYLGLPRPILEKAPSAGLWPGQKSEEELGGTFEELDSILYLIVERGYSTREAALELGKDLAFVRRIYERVRVNEHKRKTPTITRLTAMCLDKDWRYPVERE